MRMSKARLIVWLILAVYTGCLLYGMFLGFGRSARVWSPLAYNVVPFRTIGMYMRHFDSFPLRTWVINVFGNIGVFMPYGLLLPMLFRRAREYRGFLLLFAGPLAGLEMLQMVLRVGSLDVDDIILNVLGASGAYLVWKVIVWRFSRQRVDVK